MTVQFHAHDDHAAMRFINKHGLDFTSEPQALIFFGADNYEIRPLRGAFSGYCEWCDDDDCEAFLGEDITKALARFAPVAPGERLVRVI